MHKISLIMTTFNRERYIERAINSVLQQTLPDFELIVWDDGSTDDTASIVAGLAAQDSRVKVFGSQDHRGRVPALTEAHRVASGKYVGWVDSDDMLLPDALTETSAVLDDNPEIGMVYTDHFIIDADDDVTGSHSAPYSYQKLLLSFMTRHFRLIRQCVFEQAGGIRQDLPSAVDYDLSLRISEITDIHHIPIILYLHRNHPDRMSSAIDSRLLQLKCSINAIEAALERRGLADNIVLEAKIKSEIRLRNRNR